ncbi:MAG TPA: hypothetical protein PK402_09370, partial [Tepidisphaeraceae bacterium]|nr:hypothetical protein [Tepidisphaeraceae bacterium]
LVVLAPFVRIREAMPDAPWSARFMFTMGDIQYFDQVRGLAELAFGEPAVLEHVGDGFPSFPLVSVVGAAICYAMFGPAGLIVNSIISLLLTLALARILMRVMGLNAIIATTAAAVLTLVPWFDVAKLGQVSLFSFWHDRIGRPVGTIWLITLALIAFAAIVRSKHHRSSAGTWMLLALGVALTVQGNFHTGICLGLACFVLFVWTLVESIREKTIAQLLKNIALATIVGLIAMTPFFAARLLEYKPDGPQRLGMIELPRLRPFIDGDKKSILYAATGAIGASVAAAITLISFRNPTSENNPRRIWFVMPLLIVLAFFTMPISVILLGKGAQMFHFRETVRIVITIAFFSGAFLFLQLVISRIAHQRHQLACGLAVVLLIVVPITARAAFIAPTSTFTYRFNSPDRKLTGIRSEFTQLVKELESEKYKDAKVLGSFDAGVSVWWTFMHHGYTFMPDVLTSSMRETDIEKRYAIFCRELRLSSDEFQNRITMEHTLFFRIGQGIYTVNDRYHRDPLETYTLEDQESIKRTSPVRAWNMKVSIPERERLVALFESTSEIGSMPRLDLIVLTADEIDRSYQTDPARYEKTFSNGIYEVFRRIEN